MKSGQNWCLITLPCYGNYLRNTFISQKQFGDNYKLNALDSYALEAPINVVYRRGVYFFLLRIVSLTAIFRKFLSN